jgi:hypothetical protein
MISNAAYSKILHDSRKAVKEEPSNGIPNWDKGIPYC